MKIAWLCSLLAVASALIGRTDDGSSFTKLADHIRSGVIVSPPARVESLYWLAGEWECRDRALRSPSRESAYAYLNSVRIETNGIVASRAFERTNLGGGQTLALWCTFLPNAFGRVATPRSVLVEFHAKSFCFEMPNPDTFTLRRDPSNSPDWFVLEHQITGDVLFFTRKEDGAFRKPEDSGGR